MMKNFLIFFVSIVISNPCFSNEPRGKLIFAIDIIRHGERTPRIVIPTSSYVWKEGLGQLTSQGMQDAYEIGKKLRKKYIQENNFLEPNYMPETIYIRSTDVNRTIQTAQSILLGFYPLGTGPMLKDNKTPALPQAFQPIPVHTLNLPEGNNLLHTFITPSIKTMLEKEVYSQTIWQEKEKEFEPYFQLYSEIFGIKISSLEQLISIGDTLKIYKQNKVPFPKILSETQGQKIITCYEWALTHEYKPFKIGAAVSKNYLMKIYEYFHEAAEKKNKIKYNLIIAHDTTLLGFMSALKNPLDNPPDYLSNINLSLYENSNQNFIVKIEYNGKLISLPSCKNTNCTLNEFKSLVEELKNLKEEL